MLTIETIEDVKRNVNYVLAGTGFRRVENEVQPMRLLLYHLLMTVGLYDAMGDEERQQVRDHQKRYKHFFSAKFNLKERKERAEKKNSPHTPFYKEKSHQRIEQENIYMADGGDENFEIRREAFRQECLSYIGQYDEQRVADFFYYWSESSRRGKMRFEGKRYWNTDNRMRLWANRCYNLDNTSAALRLERLKAKDNRQTMQQSQYALERQQANERLDREIAERKKGAVSYEEYLRMRELKVEN